MRANFPAIKANTDLVLSIGGLQLPQGTKVEDMPGIGLGNYEMVVTENGRLELQATKIYGKPLVLNCSDEQGNDYTAEAFRIIGPRRPKPATI